MSDAFTGKCPCGQLRMVCGHPRLGTVSEARDKLGLIDGAEVWELVADGTLGATREDPDSPKWTIWDTRAIR